MLLFLLNKCLKSGKITIAWLILMKLKIMSDGKSHGQNLFKKLSYTNYNHGIKLGGR